MRDIHVPKEFHVSDSNPLPIADAIATRVICSEVLEHVDDPQQVVGELVRIGKPGAPYLLTVPDPASEGVLNTVAPESYFQRPNHIRVFEHAAFDDLITGAGLVIERRAAYSFYWTMWWTLLWVGEGVPGVNLPEAWSDIWRSVVNSPKGPLAKRHLDSLIPKSQIVVARKPI